MVAQRDYQFKPHGRQINRSMCVPMYKPCSALTGGHGGNYCGTGLDSVRKVLAERKVYLLDVEPQVSVRTLVCVCVP